MRVLVIAAFALAGCSVATPPMVAASQRPDTPPVAVSIAPAPEGLPLGDLARSFELALARALLARSIAVVPGSPEILTVAIVQRPAEVGLTAARSGNAATIRWLSAPRKRRTFECHAQRIEAVVTVRNEAQAAPLFAARGGFDNCHPGSADVALLAERFAEALSGR